MLPNLHYQRYQKFKQALEQLQQTAGWCAARYTQAAAEFQAQQFFQQQIVSLDDLEPDSQPRCALIRRR